MTRKTEEKLVILAAVVIFAMVGIKMAQGETYSWPLATTGGRQWISSDFGNRTDPMGGNGSGFHAGLDLAARKGTAVLAITDGTIVTVYPAPNGYYKGDKVYGGMCVLRSDAGLYVVFGHLSKVIVKEGQRVTRGQRVGSVGSTGISTGNHLHIEILIDPTAMLGSPEPREWRLRK